MTDVIAVTGATGAVGSRVAARLAESGATQRLVVRDAARAPSLPGAEVAAIPGGYAAGDEVRAALEGVHTLFLVPAGEAADRVEQHRTAIDAAVAAGVRRIVYLSFLGATAGHTFTFARDHWHTEEHARATGLPHAFLRMGLFLDVVPGMAQDGAIRGPAGDGRLAPVLRDDVAACAAAVLTGDGHDGRTYDLTGPEAVSLAEIAGLLGASYVDETDEEAFASRAGFGAPEFEVRGWVSSYWAIRDGSLDVVSPHVRELTGRDPVGLRAWLAQRSRAPRG